MGRIGTLEYSKDRLLKDQKWSQDEIDALHAVLAECCQEDRKKHPDVHDRVTAIVCGKVVDHASK